MSPRKAPLPPGMDEPVFAEPWHASAFAMTVALHERGLFTWTEWAAALAAEVSAAPDDAYYEVWLRALEKLAAEKRATTPDEIEILAAAWRRAAHATPHGRQIVLENDPERATRP